jgi:hypothetical protein
LQPPLPRPSAAAAGACRSGAWGARGGRAPPPVRFNYLHDAALSVIKLSSGLGKRHASGQAALKEPLWEQATDHKGRSCSVKTVARPASALNHYYNENEVQFWSCRTVRMGAGCIAGAEPALISHRFSKIKRSAATRQWAE